jgi:hypothetical protein
MKDDLSAAKGIKNAVLISIPIWVVIWWVLS